MRKKLNNNSKPLKPVTRILTSALLLTFSYTALAQLTDLAAELNPSTASQNQLGLSFDNQVLEEQRLTLQRENYLKAQNAIRKRQFSTAETFASQLGDYPLTPYVEYETLRRQLNMLPYDRVDAFLDNYQGTYLGQAMISRWLNLLARKNRWHEFRSYFEGTDFNKNRADLQCKYIISRIKTGEEEAVAETADLWNVGYSQDEDCDPLFAQWEAAGLLSQDILWQRFSKAMDRRNLQLARFLKKRMTPENVKLADLFLEVHRYPQRLKQSTRFAEQSPQHHQIILHGFRRYARKAPLDAIAAWEDYDARHYFPQEDRNHTLEYMITRLAKSGHLAAAQRFLDAHPKITDTELVEWLVRDALRSQEWQRAYNSLELLPAELQQSERWLYWRARAMEQLNLEDPNYPSPQQIYASLALTRGFYGFMSADVLGSDYTMIDRPIDLPNEVVTNVSHLPGIRRARELRAIGELTHARYEWLYTTRQLESAELLAAGKLAEQWGWYRKSIQAMVEAKHWDDLQLRFPLAFEEEVRQAALNTQLEPNFLFAIARQESAFAPDAKSSAGAMGLMQLMPATAKQTARKIGQKYNYWDLIKPEHNIKLGSSYLTELMQEFSGDRVLATAAYNAGPYRVKQWLQASGDSVPYDIWIETIPFNETRGYVQNVLSFSVIYAYRMGQTSTLKSKVGKPLQSMLSTAELLQK